MGEERAGPCNWAGLSPFLWARGWFADPHFGKFADERTLNEQDRTTLVDRIDSGASEGSVKDAPKPLEFAEGWSIGKPDVIIAMPQPFHVQASGVIEYQYVIVPTGFTEDKWVQAVEARPGNRQLVHHIIAFIREPGSKWMADAKPGVIYVPERPKRSREGLGTRVKKAARRRLNCCKDLLPDCRPASCNLDPPSW